MTSNSNLNKNARLSTVQVLAYGTLTLPLAMGFSILIMIIPTYYGLDLGLGLGIVGLTLAAGRMFDFITDPLIGNLSDRTKSRLGSHKPWIITGLFLFCCACFGLFIPPSDPTPIYFFVMACVYFLGFTLTDIPLSALGLEISNDTHERTRLAGSKTFFFIIGGILGALIPTIWADDLGLSLQYVVIAIFITSGFVLIFFLIYVPTLDQKKALNTGSIFRTYRGFMQHRDIRRIIGVFFLLMISASLSGSLSLLYVSYILKSPDLIGPVWMISGFGILCGIPIWYFLSKRLGKIHVWHLAVLFGTGFGLPLLVLGEGDGAIFVALAFGIGVCGAAEAMMPISLLADHVAKEQSLGRFGNAGSLTGFKNATSKLSIIGPMAIAFPILGAIGLSGDSVSTLSEFSGDLSVVQKFVLVGFYAGVPLLLRSAAIWVMPKFWPELRRAKLI